MQRSRDYMLSKIAGLVALAVLTVGVHRACAQQAPTPGGFQVLVTPYLWLPGVYSTIRTPLQRAPEVNSSVGPFDLLGHLDGVPFMGSAEIREGRFSLFGDVIHGPFGTDITTRNIFYQGGRAELMMNTGTELVFFRALDQPVQSLDVGGGLRAWGFSARLRLNAGLLPTATATRGAGWIDPLLGARYHRNFSDRFGLTVYGDVGPSEVGAKSDWQIIGTVDYVLKPGIMLHLGYRSLNFNYQARDSLGFNEHMRGPIIAATFRF
jgi:hypothetical protein